MSEEEVSVVFGVVFTCLLIAAFAVVGMVMTSFGCRLWPWVVGCSI